MKKVTIKRISLINFKGLREFTADFSDTTTSVMGRNGSGKTTLFDAFTWLLFGKDSLDRKQFNLKTLDSNGNAIEKLPHEVSAVLTVDGEEITLTRRFSEKWTKKRGSAIEEFKGHEEERLYNEVPCSLKDWNEKIAQICSEQVFKFITNPLYFTSQKTDVQRAMLFRMAGGVSDEDVAGENKDFKELLATISGKTLEEYKREIQAKKRVIKQDIDGIPERIDERKRDVPESENWLAIEADLESAKSTLADIDAKIADESKQMQAFNERKREAMDKLSAIRKQSGDMRSQIEQQVLAIYYEQVRRRSEIEQNITDVKNQMSRAQAIASENQQTADDLNEKVIGLRSEWKAVNAESLQFNDGDFVCPTCKRPLDVDDVEKKQAEMTANFNTVKAEKLAKLSQQGKLLNADKQKALEQVDSAMRSFNILSGKLSDLQTQLQSAQVSEKPDVAPALASSGDYQALLNSERILEDIIAESYQSEASEELNREKNAAQSKIEELTVELSKRDAIRANEKRIKELEEQMKKESVELARLEGIEFTIAEFSKARIEAIENKINSMFETVRFKMFEQQINGGEVETCEAMVDGVPFSDLNNAGKINAGLDIINTICKKEGVSAPIFVDNAEAVNELLPTESQMVRLVVTEDKVLTIK